MELDLEFCVNHQAHRFACDVDAEFGILECKLLPGHMIVRSLS